MGNNRFFQLIIGLILGLFTGVGGLTLTNQTRPAPIEIVPPAPTTTPGPTATPKPISVYINGAVQSPGIYEIPPESRLNLLLEMAGGFTQAAYEPGVNLALLLQDGQQIYIRSDEEVVANAQTGANVGLESSGTVTESTTGSVAKININSANKEELQEIPGVGPSTADKILGYREDNGPFVLIEDIMNVTGIGEAKFNKMKDIITVGNEAAP